MLVREDTSDLRVEYHHVARSGNTGSILSTNQFPEVGTLVLGPKLVA